MTQITYRMAKECDLESINNIYNHYISNSCITFDTKPWSLEERNQWYQQFDHQTYFLMVAEFNNNVIGFTYNTAFHKKEAYNRSSEITVYLDQKISQKGIGSGLFDQLFSQLKKTNLHRIYSLITLPNDASLALHKKFDFKKTGILSESGYKFGKFHDVIILEKRLNT